MKKLLIVSLMAGMSLMAMAEGTPGGEQKSSSNVKVTAQVVADNLIISDLNGKPIVLDFGKISNQKSSGVSNARIDFKVEKVGATADSLTDVAVELTGLDSGKKVQLLNTNVAATEGNKEIPATIALNAESGTFAGNEYVGFIQGTIAAEDSNNKAASTYENVLVLNVTASGAKAN